MARIWRRNWSTRGEFSVAPSGARRLELTGRVFTSLQCGRQIAQLKEEYEEAKKTLEAEAAKLRQVGVDEVPRSARWACRKHNFPSLSLQNVLSGLKDAGRHVEVAAERHTVAAHRRGAPDLKGTAHLPVDNVAFVALFTWLLLLQTRWENPAATLACRPSKTARWENWRKTSLVSNGTGHKVLRTKVRIG